MRGYPSGRFRGKLQGSSRSKSLRWLWKWVQKYSHLVADFVVTLEPQLSGDWKVDETKIKCKGEWRWFWDIIDSQTRFLVATHLTEGREKEEVVTLFRKALEVARERPIRITTDGMQSYRRGFNKVFYTNRKDRRVEYVRAPGLKARKHNNMIERWHGTLKDRYKVMRGIGRETTAKPLLDGFVVHYNFVRPHEALNGQTPAQAANVGVSESDGWGGLIRLATHFQTREN